MLQPLRFLVSQLVRSPFFLALAIGLLSSSAVLAADPAAEAKAVELTKIADEVKVREAAADVQLKAMQKQQAELQAALIKQKAEISSADKVVKEGDAKVKAEEEKVTKADAAKKPVDDALAAAKKALDTKPRAAVRLGLKLRACRSILKSPRATRATTPRRISRARPRSRPAASSARAAA